VQQDGLMRHAKSWDTKVLTHQELFSQLLHLVETLVHTLTFVEVTVVQPEQREVRELLCFKSVMQR
jgi:hypothetical protein